MNETQRTSGRGASPAAPLKAALCVIVVLACLVPLPAQEAAPLPASGVWVVDRSLMFPYSEIQDSISDYAQYAAFLSPGAFAFAAPVEDWLEIGASYAGSAVLSYAARTVLKAAVERERPHMYFDGQPSDLVAAGDHLDSFPSGHSIMAFTGAGFTAAVMAIRYPDSPYRWPATIAAYALATATAVLRVSSGSHFMTDVAAGAAIGSLFGVLVPIAVDRLGLFD